MNFDTYKKYKQYTMTQQEYLDRNALGYEGDEFIHKKLQKLVKYFNIDTIFETGTYYGHTTNRLAELVKTVYTVEIDPNYYKQAMQNKKHDNILYTLGSSPEVLNSLLGAGEFKNSLFFLDAHWGNVCPLLDELTMIAKHKLKPVIVIHDFMVPGTDLGYDTWNGQPFTYEWIKPAIDNIYGNDTQYDYVYNSEADGAKRGVIYIFPKDKPKRKRTKNVK